MRESAFQHRKPKGHFTCAEAIKLMLDVEAKALQAIEKHGAERYIAQVATVTGTAKKEAA